MVRIILDNVLHHKHRLYSYYTDSQLDQTSTLLY